jgi:Domain of unknown function (DUF4032)/Lipopolysaccharide kinase (Kdo/WaaP) family
MRRFWRSVAVTQQSIPRSMSKEPLGFTLVLRPGHPDFLDLPWREPLEGWRSDRLVELEAGIHRHVVRFVDYQGRLYTLKELPQRLAEREYRLLRHLETESIPVVQAVGMVARRAASASLSRLGADADLGAVLITRHLAFSLPYRALFSTKAVDDIRDSLLDALANLLVRIHLAGFYWGDCSLSNTLFRRDAGALAAYLVDAETGELHPRLSDGQRRQDVAIAEENVAGELMDLEAAGELPTDLDPIETAREVPLRYEALWSQLTREETFGGDERFRIQARLRAVSDLGFDVEEVELVATPEGRYRLRLSPEVVEPGHHSRRLLLMTGIVAQENQASRLLQDIAYFRAQLPGGKSQPEHLVAAQWLASVYEPTMASIPPELRGRMERAEIYHQILEHRWFLSETSGRDVGLKKAVASYVRDVLPQAR